MDPTKSKWFNPNRVNKSIDNKFPVSPSDKQPEKRYTKERQIESGSESGNDCLKTTPGQLFWLNRHQLTLVPILNSSKLPKQGKRVIIEVPDNDVEWETGIVARPMIHKIYVRREDVVDWSEGQSIMGKLLEQQYKLIEEMNSVD